MNKENIPSEIKDSFGRVHNYLRISLTDKCNFRCVYCMPDEKIEFKPSSELLSTEELLSIVQIFVNLGVTKIRLTGGEPLVRKDAAYIIEELGKLPIELAITTNGFLIDQYKEIFIKSGLKSINISLDTLDEAKFLSVTQRNYFKKVRQNIDQFIKDGFHLKINVVALKDFNKDEILDFVKWTKDTRIHIRFIEFMPFGGNKWDLDKILSYKQILEIINSSFEIERLSDAAHDTAKNFRVKNWKGTFAIISSITAPFCDTCNRIRITADGKLKNCLFSQKETDLLSAYRKGEDIKPLIYHLFKNKAAERAGLAPFADKNAKNTYDKGRSMISIGG